MKVVDLHGEELDFVPGVKLRGAVAEKGNELFDVLAEAIEACLLEIGEGPFGDDAGGLVFGIVGVRGVAKPKDVDGDALLEEGEVSGGAGGGVAAIAADGEVGGDVEGAGG